MSEGEGSQQQRYCTNCGAEIRPGTRFCVSCGVPLNQRTDDTSPPTPEPPTPAPFDRFANALRETFRGLTQRVSEASSTAGGATAGDIPARIINWFRDLPSVPKLILVGLILLLLLIVLSPLALVVAALVLGVSVIALILRLAQRRSIRGWGIAAVASLASLFVLGGVSDAIYGTGFLGSGGSEASYEIIREGEAPIEGDLGVGGFLIVASDSLDEEQLQAIAQDIIPRTREYEMVSVSVYDRDEAYYEDGIRSIDTGELYPGDLYNIWIAHTAVGESMAEMSARVGEYAIERVPGPGNPDEESYGDIEYYSYDNFDAETGTLTNSDEANADALFYMLRAGMVDGEETIQDVEVSGEKATVIVSGVPGEYAESVCYFALDAAQEYGMESESNDYARITQVTVKRPWRPWSAASCSW